jgi:adenine phosphoribosyltransferase
MTDTSLELRVRRALRAIPDYPNPGIVFQDITPVLGDGALFRDVVEAMAAPFRSDGVTHVIGIEARGFILGGAVAANLGAGFVPVRKPGKLPWERVREEYTLEYGVDALEAHRDGIASGHRVLIVDDVLATGGTAKAASGLARALGAELAGWSFLLEIAALNGHEKLGGARAVVLARV